MQPNYDQLKAQLLREYDRKPRQSNQVEPIRTPHWNMNEEDDERIAMIICDETGMAFERWDSLTESQRRPYLEKMLERVIANQTLTDDTTQSTSDDTNQTLTDDATQSTSDDTNQTLTDDATQSTSDDTNQTLTDDATQSTSDGKTECPPEYVQFLENLYTAKQLGSLIFLNKASVKSHHREAWGTPAQPSKGRRPAKWRLKDALPAILKELDGRSLRLPPSD